MTSHRELPYSDAQYELPEQPGFFDGIDTVDGLVYEYNFQLIEGVDAYRRQLADRVVEYDTEVGKANADTILVVIDSATVDIKHITSGTSASINEFMAAASLKAVELIPDNLRLEFHAIVQELTPIGEIMGYDNHEVVSVFNDIEDDKLKAAVQIFFDHKIAIQLRNDMRQYGQPGKYKTRDVSSSASGEAARQAMLTGRDIDVITEIEDSANTPGIGVLSLHVKDLLRETSDIATIEDRLAAPDGPVYQAARVVLDGAVYRTAMGQSAEQAAISLEMVSTDRAFIAFESATLPAQHRLAS